MSTTLRSSMGRGRSNRSTARPAPPVSLTGMPVGKGRVGSSVNPSPKPPGAPGSPTPNSGGFYQRSGGIPNYEPPDPNYKGPAATGNFGPGPDTSKAWRGTARPAPAPLPVNRPQQTERADPLNGAGGPPQVPGTSRTVSEAPDIDPGKALGASTRGNQVPKGEDRHPLEDENSAPDATPTPSGAEPGEEEDLDKEANDDDTIGGHIGGSGASMRKFSKPTPSDAYESSAKSLSGQPKGARIFSGRAAGTSSASMLKKGNPRDNGDESSGGEDY